MRITQRQLRRIVEAEVDKMRLPKGPNSRDPDEDVNDLAEARLHEEADPMIGDMLTVARDFDDYLYEIYDDLEQGSGRELSARGINALEAMQRKTDMLIMHLSKLDAGLRKMPG